MTKQKEVNTTGMLNASTLWLILHSLPGPEKNVLSILTKNTTSTEHLVLKHNSNLVARSNHTLIDT